MTASSQPKFLIMINRTYVLIDTAIHATVRNAIVTPTMRSLRPLASPDNWSAAMVAVEFEVDLCERAVEVPVGTRDALTGAGARMKATQTEY